MEKVPLPLVKRALFLREKKSCRGNLGMLWLEKRG